MKATRTIFYSALIGALIFSLSVQYQQEDPACDQESGTPDLVLRQPAGQQLLTPGSSLHSYPGFPSSASYYTQTDRHPAQEVVREQSDWQTRTYRVSQH